MQKRRLQYFSLTLILLSSGIFLNMTDFDKVYAQETVDYQKLSDAQDKLTEFSERVTASREVPAHATPSGCAHTHP